MALLEPLEGSHRLDCMRKRDDDVPSLTQLLDLEGDRGLCDAKFTRQPLLTHEGYPRPLVRKQTHCGQDAECCMAEIGADDRPDGNHSERPEVNRGRCISLKLWHLDVKGHITDVEWF